MGSVGSADSIVDVAVVEDIYMVSSAAMDILIAEVVMSNNKSVMLNILWCLSDSGANVHIANKRLSEALVQLGFIIEKVRENKEIQTANKSSKLTIDG